jgi:3-deoxy-D-manno-octulosonate 8-phosphate phosphatase (KDO 8-P phosphatase)
VAEKLKRTVSAQIARRAKPIKLIAMDVDGVLTAGEIILLESGEEIKFWNARDRLGLAVVREHKVPLSFAWITGRSSRAVSFAAEDLGVAHLVQKCADKRGALKAILDSRKIGFHEAAFIGDDLIDLPVLRAVGLAACPADAAPDVRRHVHYVSPFGGGKGAVRDVLELVLRAQGRWDALLESYLS